MSVSDREEENAINMNKRPFGGFQMLIWMMLATSAHAQTPVLNELMTSNDLAYYDDFFEFDDWVELYNPEACFSSQVITCPTIQWT